MNWKALGITASFMAGLVFIMAMVIVCINEGIYWAAYFTGATVIVLSGVCLYLVIKDDR